MAFFIEYSRTKKSKYRCHPPLQIYRCPPSPIFCRHYLKLLSPTLQKFMNLILLSAPPLSSDPDTPPKGVGTCTMIWMSLTYVIFELEVIKWYLVLSQSRFLEFWLCRVFSIEYFTLLFGLRWIINMTSFLTAAVSQQPKISVISDCFSMN